MKLLSGLDSLNSEGGFSIEECLPGRGSAHLLLCTFGEREIRSAMRRFGVTAKLEQLGYSHYDVTIDASDLEHQRLQFFGWKAGEPSMGEHEQGRGAAPVRIAKPLGEVILREAVLQPSVPGFDNVRPFSFLIIQWIRLQDASRVEEERRLLPGQEHPGLGMGEAVMDMLKAMAKMRRMEGMINRPEFLHNAILYLRHFRFMNPDVKGRLDAIERDIKGLTLRQLSWAAEKGLLVEDDEKVYFRWFQAEQVWPNCAELEQFLSSDAYANAAAQAAQEHSYSLREGALEDLARICDP